jgi:hypothetical protein
MKTIRQNDFLYYLQNLKCILWKETEEDESKKKELSVIV